MAFFLTLQGRGLKLPEIFQVATWPGTHPGRLYVFALDVDRLSLGFRSIKKPRSQEGKLRGNKV